MKKDTEILEYSFPRNDIKIYPVADLHVGAQEFDESEWDKFSKMVQSDPLSRIVLVGDMMNNATKSSVTNVFEETMRPRAQKEWLVNALKPLKDKILCAVSGNHERRSGKDADDDPMYDILCKIDIEDVYRPNAAILALRFGDATANGEHNPTYSMLCTHGAGGGMLTGAGVNRSERFGYVFDGLDILVTGHTHKPVITAPSKICIDLRNRRITQKPFLCVTATSWLDYGGYSLQKMMLPTSRRIQAINLCGTKKEFSVTM